MIRRAITGPSETVGERLRRECESIVDTAHPPANLFVRFPDPNYDYDKHPNEEVRREHRIRESRIRDCVMKRGVAGR
jgi:hypothetical protein